MGKFKQLLDRTSDKILKDRGARIEKSAKREYNNIVVNLDAKIDELTDELELMLDQNPDNRYSLKPGQKFEAASFANDFQNKSIELANKKIELQIAQSNLEELFGDDETEETND